jgi:hypothetical protein
MVRDAERPRVVAYADSDLIMTSYATAGLIDAAKRGSIDLEFRLPLRPDVMGRYRGRATLWLSVRAGGGRERLACLDLHDKSNYFCRAGLDLSALYFKSNFSYAEVDRLPADQRKKLRPLGPFWYCRSNHDRALGIRVLGSTLSNLRWAIRNRSRIGVSTLTANLKRYARYRNYARVVDCEASADAPVAKKVFFYALCYPEGRGNDEINRTRAAVIRALRAMLKERFVGGFTPDSNAQALFPDCVSPRLDADAYVRAIKESLICIYTNGNQGCISSKLDMFLAAAKVIVAEPWDGELVAPLTDGRDVFLFRSADECAEICRHLLDDDASCSLARNRAARYYADYVKPSARIESVVKQVLAV